jgi:hypothetical protein
MSVKTRRHQTSTIKLVTNSLSAFLNMSTFDLHGMFWTFDRAMKSYNYKLLADEISSRNAFAAANSLLTRIRNSEPHICGRDVFGSSDVAMSKVDVAYAINVQLPRTFKNDKLLARKMSTNLSKFYAVFNGYFASKRLQSLISFDANSSTWNFSFL